MGMIIIFISYGCKVRVLYPYKGLRTEPVYSKNVSFIILTNKNQKVEKGRRRWDRKWKEI